MVALYKMAGDMGTPHGYMGTHAAWVQKLILCDKGQICIADTVTYVSTTVRPIPPSVTTVPTPQSDQVPTTVRPIPASVTPVPRHSHTHPCLHHTNPHRTHTNPNHSLTNPCKHITYKSEEHIFSTLSSTWLCCQHHTIQPKLSVLQTKHMLPISCFCAAKQ